MSWVALMQREFKGHVRPAGKWSGLIVAATVIAVILGALATVAAGLLAVGLQGALGDDLSVYATAAAAVATGVLGAALAGLLVPMNLGIEAVVGERERHTLGTLLATPLSDAAIVWAKTLAIMLVTSVVAIAGGLAVWITATVLFGLAGLLWGILAIPAAVVVTAVPAFFTVCFAFVFCMRAKTVKDAGQRMSYIMLPMMLPFFLAGPILTGASAAVATMFFIVAGTLVGGLSLLWPILAFVRFRREKLLAV